MKKMKLYYYAQKILDWAHERGIDTPENIEKQQLKLVEEIGELAEGINKHRIDQVKDSIGDTFVVLVILFKKMYPYATSPNNNLGFDEAFKDLEESCEISTIQTAYYYFLQLYKANDFGIANIIEQSCDTEKVYSDDEYERKMLNDYKRVNNQVMKYLSYIAQYYDTTLTDCVAEAYDTIKDRTGETKNGVFIKKEDL